MGTLQFSRKYSRFASLSETDRELLQQCKSNAEWLNIDPSLIILCGSSAGANLTAVVAQMARDNNDSGIVAQVLNGPVICHPDHFPRDGKYEYNSWMQNQDASILSAHTMRRCWDAYYPSAGTDVNASPMLAKSLQGLPTACMSEFFFQAFQIWQPLHRARMIS